MQRFHGYISRRHSIYSHGEYRHCDPNSSAVDAGRGELMGAVVGAGCGNGTGTAASARKPYAAPTFQQRSLPYQ